jgi:LacI family transcriptional regulator
MPKSNDGQRHARPTLKQVAEAAGVSVATASYALNNGGSVGRETRDRVIATAERLGYAPNLSAKAMRTGRSGTLGLVLPDLTNPFFPLLSQTIIHAARERGYSVFLTDTQGSKDAESESIDTLIQRGIDGIIWFPIDDDTDRQPSLRGVPTVVVDRSVQGFDSVQADYEAGGRLAAQHLVEAGHKKIGLITGPRAALSARRRADAARDYVQAHAQLAWEVESSFAPDLDAALVERMLKRDATAIIAGADLIALGAIKSLRNNGVDVPNDMSVIGFDNTPWGEWSAPPLTTIDIPTQEMAAEAVELLVRRIEQPGEPRRHTVFDVSLVARNSVAPPSSRKISKNP